MARRDAPCARGVHDPLSWQPIAYVDSAVAEALALEYPDPVTRARVLFEWYGQGEGPWSGYPAYEGVPEQCLLQLPLDALVEGALSEPRTEALLEGAARFFSGWNFGKHRKKDRRRIPVDLKSVLLAHCLASRDEDARSVGKRAFGD